MAPFSPPRQWFVRVTSHGWVATGLALALGYYSAGAAQGAGRAAVITTITAILTLVNVLGIRQGSRTVNALTIAKLVPLGLFIAIGVFFISPARFTALPEVGLEQASTAALLTIFVFGGYEVLTGPAGEANDPRRHVPSALITTVIVVGAVTILCQVVAVGTLDNLAASTTPLADAAAGFLGGPGALLIGLGALASMTGNLAGQILTGSRMLYALAEQGDLPRALARVHPGFRTPVNAILFTAGAALALALSGSFAWLAIASAVARLVTYGVSCGAAVALGRPGRAGRAGAALFVSPLSPLVPALGMIITVLLAVSASRAQLAPGAAALAAGALLYLASRQSPSAQAGRPVSGWMQRQPEGASAITYFNVSDAMNAAYTIWYTGSDVVHAKLYYRKGGAVMGDWKQFAVKNYQCDGQSCSATPIHDEALVSKWTLGSGEFMFKIEAWANDAPLDIEYDGPIDILQRFFIWLR